MKSQEAKQPLSLDWDFVIGQYVLVSIRGKMLRKAGFVFFVSLKLFHFCLGGRWHFWFQSGTFSDDFDVPLSRFSIVLSRSVFIFFAIVCSPELLHTQGLHKFFGSISGVVSMNNACILKMISTSSQNYVLLFYATIQFFFDCGQFVLTGFQN